MQKVELVGRFVHQGNYLNGEITFYPSRFWYTVGGKHYALLSPSVRLIKGAFSVEVTVLDKFPANMYYRVNTPIGDYAIRPFYSETSVQLTDLVKKRVT